MDRKNKQNHHTFLRWIIKITGWPLALLFFRRKVYFTNSSIQKRHLKKGALLISNHRSFWDYVTYFFLFPFSFIRPVVSYEMYHKNKILTFYLNLIGAIPLSKNPFDFSWMEETIELLKKGKKIIIFPEAHFIQEDKLSKFYSSYIIIAKKAKAPIIPLYTNGVYKSWKRNRVVIGEPIDLSKISSDESLNHEKREELNEHVREIIKFEAKLCSAETKKGLFRFRYFLYDLGRLVVFTHFSWMFNVKCISYDGKKRQCRGGSFIIVSNHERFMDPFVLTCAFYRRRLKILAADIVFGMPKEKKVRSFWLRQAGVIKISRENMDIEAISNCSKTLNEGFPLVIFPEGHLETKGHLEALKMGAAMIANRNETPILPVFILYKKKWFRRTRIYIGKEIIPSKKKSLKAIEETTKQIEEAMDGLRKMAEKDNDYE